ncbi:NRAMP-like transporter smf-3 [Elasticomyces elasticus]|nr:NRAMP-like transporter smf-3 [Elasticomyces elasticus]
MNCPSRTDPDYENDAWNQSPNTLASDLTTRSDLNGLVNRRQYRDHRLELENGEHVELQNVKQRPERNSSKRQAISAPELVGSLSRDLAILSGHNEAKDSAQGPARPGQARTALARTGQAVVRARDVLRKYAKFVGPGFMISVAYIDPGNYATDVAAGATFRFKLLVLVLVSNIIAIFLQSLCIKLGSVTGMNLAQNCKAHLPRWMNVLLFFFAEAAIIATDIAEVIGTAIALNLLLHIPLVAGCAISIVDVMATLIFYKPEGSMRGIRYFEYFVMGLVLAVVICFCIQLSYIRDTSVGEVFRGYLPSSVLIQGQGIYQACGILGATVMPHSLYLGSSMVQPRLKEFDISNGHFTPPTEPTSDAASTVSDDPKPPYRPSISAIRSCMHYAIVELGISLFTFALFVNSAILIVAGASLSNNSDAAAASLFQIHDLLSKQLAPVAGTIFALALLLSGTSAGIICTIAGQIVCEGQLSWHVKPWQQRLITRSISITPSIIIAGAVGQKGLSVALEASQVALSVLLPFCSAPLIYFTCRNKFMTVARGPSDVAANTDGDVGVARTGGDDGEGGVRDAEGVKMRNHWFTAVIAVLIWLIIFVMNVAAMVLLGLGVK